MNSTSRLPARPSGTITTTIEIAGRARSFRLWDNPLSRSVFGEVFSGRSYPLVPILGEVRTVLDVGANVGASAVYFAMHYPHARVLVFEPAPDSYEVLATNTADLANVAAYPVGLWDRDAELPLFLGREDSATDSLGQSTLNTAENVLVQVREAACLLRELGVEAIDVLKLDTEGCEVPILGSIGPLVPRTGVVYVEYHAESDRREIDRMLAQTHLLWQARAPGAHRGELCYVLEDRVPPQDARMRVIPPLGTGVTK